jgi:hypothetical protein
MTCKEKIMEQHPDDYNYALAYQCPHEFNLNVKPDCCCDNYCGDCWDREVLDTKGNTNTEKKPTAAPNYKAMYEETLCRLEEANAKIRDMNHREEIWLRKQSYYRGVTEALELVYGRKLGFLQCGGTE